MRKAFFLVCCLVLIVMVAGCANVEVRKVVRDRVDIKVAGNQGVISGPIPEPYTVENIEREYFEINIELATLEEVQKKVKKEISSKQVEKTDDKENWGNAGVIASSVAAKVESEPKAAKISLKPDKVVIAPPKPVKKKEKIK